MFKVCLTCQNNQQIYVKMLFQQISLFLILAKLSDFTKTLTEVSSTLDRENETPCKKNTKVL